MFKRRKMGWQQLPDDVLFLITNKLTELKDFIRWGRVCHSWRSSFIAKFRQNQIHLPHQPPLLLLENKSNQDDQSRSFYSITEERFYDIRVPLPHDKICPGSSHGWLITMTEEDYQVILINPFMSFNNQITLPCLPHEIEMNLCLHKVVLSANPLFSPTYKAIAIYGPYRKLAFFNPGDTEWKSCNLLTYIHDVICYNQQILAVNKHGEVFDCGTNNQVAPCLKANSCTRYLVESSGELLQVLKYESRASESEEDEEDEEDEEIEFKDGFDVFKFNEDACEWIKMENLEGRVLFVGGSISMSVSRSEFPKLKSDAIYFTDDNDDDYIGGRWCDMGVFCIVDQIISTHFPNSYGEPIVPIPIWVNPMFCIQ